MRRRMVGIAQLVEHLVVVQDVAGSSPVTHPKREARSEQFQPIGAGVFLPRVCMSSACAGPLSALAVGARARAIDNRGREHVDAQTLSRPPG